MLKSQYKQGWLASMYVGVWHVDTVACYITMLYIVCNDYVYTHVRICSHVHCCIQENVPLVVHSVETGY